jgi:hypothetical protein
MANIQEQITKARDAGYSDDEIAQHLSSSPEYSSQMKSAFDAGYSSAEILGHLSVTPTAPTTTTPSGIPGPRKYAASEVPGAALRNLPKSTVEFAGNLISPIIHPVNTFMGLGDVLGGVMEPITPDILYGKEALQKAKAARSGFADFLVERYGGTEQLKRTMAEDPVGFLGDLSTVLSGGAAGAGKLGATGTSSVLAKGAAYTNPLTPVAAGGKYAYGKLVPEAEKTAAAITRKAAGEDLDTIRAILNEDKSGLTVADLLADLDRNQIHALGELARTKDTTNFYSKLDKFRKQSQETTLNNLAGGATNTEILNNLAKSKQALTDVTTPMRETNLAAANTGKLKQGLEQQAATLGEVAANKVDDVRRFTAARDRLSTAGAKRGAAETGRPTPNKYTLEGEMSDAAERVATRAADDSLKYGEGARFAQRRADSLAAEGLTPLDTDGVIRDINAKLNNPKIGVSDVNRKVLTTVANKIKEWTARNGGVIDVNALYEIRKGTVNEVIESLGKDPKASAKYASKLLGEVRPLIDDAIIKAGGTGWKDYLDTFSHGMDVINQRKMAQTARDLYKKSPDEFVALVRGERPDLVEQIFGSGRIDLKAEMGGKFQALDNVAHELERASKIKGGAELGAAHLKDIAKQETPKLRIPFFGLKATVGNAVLKELSGRINDKTMQILERGFQSGKNFEDMLNEVPFGDRGRVYNALQKVNRAQLTGAASVSNMLAPQNRNELRN